MISIPRFDVLAKMAKHLKEVPYNVTPQRLYTASSLYERLVNDDSVPLADCYDQRVYQYYLSMGKHATDEKEMLSRSLHDYGIGKSLDKYLAQYDRLKVVGVMGGVFRLPCVLILRIGPNPMCQPCERLTCAWIGKDRLKIFKREN